ncbi:hypothetical protein EGS38_11810 [Neisseria chenwenguii]|nr:hypothetical protein EGS38_11810 [Neisseria chenwenguii]
MPETILFVQIIHSNKTIIEALTSAWVQASPYACLSAPTQNGVGIAAATLSPALSYEIGQYFKAIAEENKRTGKTQEAELTTGQQTAHILAHAVLGAATAAAGEHNALAGAISAGGAEAAAPVIGKWLYGKDKGSDLTAEEKEAVTAITNLLGTAAGGAVGNSTANAVQGSLNAQGAVENNHLRKGQREIKKAELRSCKGDFLCELKVEEKWEQIGLQNLRELYAACDKGIKTAECNNFRNQIDTSTYQGKRDYNYPTGLELKSELAGAIGVGPQVNGKVTITVGNRGSSAQAEGGIGLGIGVIASGGISKQTRKLEIDDNKSFDATTEYTIWNPKFGSNPSDNNATLGTKLELEGKALIFHGNASIYGGREYKSNNSSSIYRGAEGKVSTKTQIGSGLMLKWDIWNGRTQKYDYKIKR